MSLTLVPIDQGSQMVLHLEPAEGSDVQVGGGPRAIIEQVKMRNTAGKWDSGEVASKVFPDLLKAVRLTDEQEFRFVTNNGAGLGRLQDYVAALAEGSERRHKWGNSNLTRTQFELRLAQAAGLSSVGLEFRHLLDHFRIEVIDVEGTEDDIDKTLKPLLKPGESQSDKRYQLLGQLMPLATHGAKLSPEDLLALISPHAHRRLAHIQSLPELLARHIDEDTQLVGYSPEQQARRGLPDVLSSFSILSEESGQGKTYTLAQLAFDQIERGELAIVMRSPTKIEDVIACISERIWEPAYEERGTVAIMAKSLRDAFDGGNGTWLTLYIDDVQDREFAQRLARSKWHEYGVRVIVSAQPRITSVVRSIRQDVGIIEIGNFRSADLFRFLTHHGRAEALETMPDDVFELLLKPVHASIFVKLPKRASWAGVSEYELFRAYWEYASLEAREQADHPSDKYALRTLAAQLLNGQSHYPWRIADLQAVDLNDQAILRLEQVGLLRRPVPDRIQFAADRMLNWAIAESMAEKIQEDGLTAPQADALFASIEGLQTKKKERIGTRLVYVYFDALSLLASQCEPQFIADLIWEQVVRLPQEARSEDQWRNGFGSLGVDIVPALELLSRRAFDEERDWDIPRNIPFALAAVAASDPDPVQNLIARQVASDNEHEVVIGLRAARLIQAPAALDAIWEVHLARSIALEEAKGNTDIDIRSRAFFPYQLSSEAFHVAVSADNGWVDAKLASETNPVGIDQLVWVLKDPKSVNSETAIDIWARHRDRIVAINPMPSPALISAIGHFRETSLLPILDAAAEDEDGTRDSVLRSLARLAPQDAIRQIAEGSDVYGWSAANWWFDELRAADPSGLANAIRTRSHAGNDPVTDIALYYRFNPEAMDLQTLNEMLDAFAEDLRNFNTGNGDADRHEGRLGHPLRFLPRLSEPWQYEAMRRRAGTGLETQLVRFASARRGRMSMTRDTTGNECERILAMIGGNGFDQLIQAELGRPNVFGRQDGYVLARWSSSSEVTSALAQTPEEADAQPYGQSVRMEALAVHGCDEQLEAMVRGGVAVYVNAAQMRSTDSRDLLGLRARITELINLSDPKSLEIAVALTGFLGDATDAVPLVAIYLAPETPVAVRRMILGSFRALHFYAPELLPLASDLLKGQFDDEAQFIATYLAERGDKDATQVVIDWLAGQDVGNNSTSRRSYLNALLDSAAGKAAVVKFLRRSREKGHLVVDGNQLQLLAEAGDEWAQRELVRASYRYSGFDRGNAIIAIDYLRGDDPDEAYFSARRLLVRHGLAVAADLMLEIDSERAGQELIDLYRTAKSSLRLELERRLRVQLGVKGLATLIAPLAAVPRARDRTVAARLAAVIPPAVSLPWLKTLAEDVSPGVQEAARDAVRRRGLEAAAMVHRELLMSSPKPLQWARLSTIIELVDPFFLWSREDPTNLKEIFDTLPYEFLDEARDMRKRQLKAREDAALKADKDH
ncbi:hypothetical protein [Sphingomonas sp. PAMC 26617]|uniref:hypothetical protein n=1 Tax=Sphingomonas sp. PAMC 26617 TaxID=1112216 RepID=UPI0012F51EAE|nr:hypothetical protein [Sphingomonas sp. PAMC 26617]